MAGLGIRYYVSTDHFSGSGRANGPVCVCVQIITIKQYNQRAGSSGHYLGQTQR